jgi:hypothetical protein
MKYYYLLFFVFFLFGFRFSNSDKFPSLHTNTIYKEFNASNNRLKLNGIYLVYEYNYLTLPILNYNCSTPYKYSRFISFYNNGFCNWFRSHADKDSFYTSILIKSQNEYDIKNGGGVFNINGDTITTVIKKRISMPGGGLGYTYAIFRGTIKNADTIIDFKMIAPFPKHKNLFDTMSKLLVFQEFPDKLNVDSNNYFIKKYIKNE